MVAKSLAVPCARSELHLAANRTCSRNCYLCCVSPYGSVCCQRYTVSDSRTARRVADGVWNRLCWRAQWRSRNNRILHTQTLLVCALPLHGCALEFRCTRGMNRRRRNGRRHGGFGHRLRASYEG